MSIIETIKAKIDVVEEIGLVVALQKSGKALKSLCPFHNERTPSFYVFAETQTWRCFGCNEGGDVFSFVQKQQGLDFRETLHYLAEKAGVQVDDYSSQNPEQARETRSRENAPSRSPASTPKIPRRSSWGDAPWREISLDRSRSRRRRL